MQNFSSISEQSIPRHLTQLPNAEHHLVAFLDASTKAYGTAIYLVSTSSNSIESALMFSKLRLKPVSIGKTGKEMSIPHMELMGVLIAVHMLHFVSMHIQVPVQSTVVYTDLQCVLGWVYGKDSSETFVKNRISEIRHFESFSFHFVPTTENPADLLTRGISAGSLLQCALWWSGPTWLQQLPLSWPKWKLGETESEITAGMDNTVQLANQCTNSLTTKLQSPFGIDSAHFSSISKLHHVTTQCGRFIANLRQQPFRDFVPGPLSISILVSELQNAEKMWLLYLQSSFFAELVECVKNATLHHMQKQLGVFLDSNKIARCAGRFEVNRNTLNSFPILLLRKSYYTELQIQ